MWKNLVLAILFLSVTGCSPDPYDQYIGYWKSDISHPLDGLPQVMLIKKEEGIYILNPDIAARAVADFKRPRVKTGGLFVRYRSKPNRQVIKPVSLIVDKENQRLEMRFFGIPIPLVLSEENKDVLVVDGETHTRISQDQADNITSEVVAFYQREHNEYLRIEKARKLCEQTYESCEKAAEKYIGIGDADPVSVFSGGRGPLYYENSRRCSEAKKQCLETGEAINPAFLSQKEWNRIASVKKVCSRKRQNNCDSKNFPREACEQQEQVCVDNDGDWADPALTERYLMCQRISSETCDTIKDCGKYSRNKSCNPEWLSEFSWSHAQDYARNCRNSLPTCYETGEWVETERFQLLTICGKKGYSCAKADRDDCTEKYTDCLDLGEWRE